MRRRLHTTIRSLAPLTLLAIVLSLAVSVRLDAQRAGSRLSYREPAVMPAIAAPLDCPSDGYEPNDDFFTAYAINSGTTYHGIYICPSGDEDWFKISVTSGEQITVDLTNLPADFDLYLFDPAGTLVDQSTSSSTVDEQIVYTAEATGDYRVGIFGYEGAYSESACSLRVELDAPECPDTYEPNDTFAQAWSIASDTLLDSYVCHSEDLDYFSFEATAGQNIQIDLYDLPADYDLVLYDASQNELQSSAAGGTASEQIVYEVVDAGTYYAHVRGYYGAYDPLDPYTLLLTLTDPECPDSYEPNNSFAEAIGITPGGEVNSYVCNSDDLDYFAFSVTEGQEITLQLDGMDYNANLELYDPTQTLLGNSFSAGTTPEEIVVTAGQSGTYYALVLGTQGELVNAYTLLLTVAGLECPDTYEPNEIFDQAIPITPGDEVQSYVCSSDDLDYFAFEVGAGHEIVVQLYGMDYNADLDLYDATETEVAQSHSGGITPEEIVVTADQAGTYYAKVLGTQGEMVNAYTLLVTLTAPECPDEHEPNENFDQAVDILPGEAITSYVCSSGDLDFFAIPEIEPGYELEIALDGVPEGSLVAAPSEDLLADLDLYLFDPQEEQVALSDAEGVEAERILHTATVSGTYWVQVVAKPGQAEEPVPYRLHSTFDYTPTLLVVNTTSDTVDPQGCTAAHCSLQEAVREANQGSGGTISFNIPESDSGYDAGTGAWTINNQFAPFVLLADGIAIDGRTQPGSKPWPRIEVDGSAFDWDACGFRISADDAQISGLSITGYRRCGILIDDDGARNHVFGNYIGLDPEGNADPNGTGIELLRAKENTIGGKGDSEGNIISGNANDGILLMIDAHDNEIMGNRIGLALDGQSARANGGNGIKMMYGSNNNRIGTGEEFGSNVISGNRGHGILLSGDVKQNVIAGNTIGLDITSSEDVGNAKSGVAIEGDAYHNTIGGTADADRNLISGNNERGIDVSGGRVHVIRNNYIGVNGFGDTKVPNGMSGIRVGGGATYGVIANNLVSGNKAYGLILTGPNTAHNTTTGNRIGVGATGRYAVANDKSGVLISAGAHHNTVFNSVVSGNKNGIELSGPATHDNIIRGNIVGLGLDGTQPVANWYVGILISDSYSNTIHDNVVSGNGSHGIQLQGGSTAHNRISGNAIGMSSDRQTSSGNIGTGIHISLGAHNNVIGPTNYIKHNFQNGVGVYSYTTDYNTITRNSIAENNRAGIHVVDGNDSIQPPTISSVARTAAGYRVTGTALPNATVELFSDPGDEGEVFEGSTTADAAGSFNAVIGGQGNYVTATQTDGAGNTSAFSNRRSLTCPDPYEINDSMAMAKPISGTIEGFICRKDDLDFYVVELKKGQASQRIIQVKLEHPDETYPVSIMDANGRTLADGVFTGSDHDVIASFGAFADATLYILVHAGNSPPSPARPYQLQVLTFDCNDTYEPNDFFSLARNLGTGDQFALQSYLCRAWDKDYFWFSASAGQRINLYLTGPTDYEATLYDPWKAKVETSRSRIHHDALVSGDYFVRVQSRSGYRYSADRPYELAVSLGPKPSLPEADFSLLDIEVTQSIQNLANDIPLISRKPTYARLYVGCRGCALDVGGHLTAKLDGETLDPPQVPCSFTAIARDITTVSTRERGSWERAVNCLLPTSWTATPGMLEITGYVHDTEHDDPRINDNTLSASLRVRESAPLHLKVVQVRDGCDPGECTEAHGPSPKEYAGIDRLIERMYPVDTIDFIPHNGATVPWLGENPTIASLHALHATTYVTQPNTFVMGVVRDHVLMWKRGRGEQGTANNGNGIASWIEIVGKDSEKLAAHELGHNLRLNHVDCCWYSPPDPPYDHYDGEPYIGSGDVRGMYGFDLGTNPPVVKPRDRHEVMTYASGKVWIAEPHYRTLDFALREGAGMTTTVQAAYSTSETFLIISGSIYTETDEANLLPIRRVNGGELNPFTSTNGPGDYTLRLLDGAGTTLYEQSFGVVPGHDEGEGSPLFLIVPDQVGLQRLEIVHGSAELYAEDATPNPPILILHSVPDILPQNLVVSWTADDADGDTMSADISLSSDGGATWKPLAVGIPGRQTEFDTSLWPQTDRGMLRVQVSDGLNTAIDVTGPFTIIAKAPVVFVTSPADGDLLAPGWSALLTANGYDAEDGPMDGNAMVWSSNRDGALGNGDRIVAADLSLGWHEITVSVTDSDDNTATDSINVYVGYRTYLPTLLRASDSSAASAHARAVKSGRPSDATGALGTIWTRKRED